jgi:MSHA biogenesis protein MshJ
VKNLWRTYAGRIDAMSLRERATIFAASAVLLVTVVYSLWIDSAFTRSNRLNQEVAQRQADMNQLQEQINKLTGARKTDPDQANRDRLTRMKTQLAKVESTIAAEERKFTAPDKMRAVLEELLAKNRRVRLVSLRTLPVTSIAEERAVPGAAATPPGALTPPSGRLIFRHGVDLTVSGAYLDVLAYLSDLERLPTQLYWSGLGVEAEPAAATVTVKITVFTLSLDRAWLSV